MEVAHGLTVATYNVAWPDNQGRRVEFLLRNILRSQADIIGLQEVRSDCPLCAQLRATHPYQWSAPGHDNRGLTLTVASRLPLSSGRDHREVRFEHLGGKSEPTRFSRDLLRVDFDWQGEEWSFYTTHLKSMRGGAYAHLQRESEALAVANLLAEQMPAGRPFVLSGDLNDGVDSPSTRRLLGGPLDLHNSLVGAKRQQTFPTQGPRHQFDYLLYPAALAPRLQHSQVWPESRGSDHALVSARFAPPASPI